MTKQPVFPLFVFHRQRDIEREAGVALAGKERMDNEERRLREILEKFTAAVCKIGADEEVLVGWPDGVKPEDRGVAPDHARMEAWFEERVVIGVMTDDRAGALILGIEEAARH